MALDEASTPTSSAAQDSDLDPAAFLKSVRALSDKRDREDAERFRQLEEKVQREREERAARRAESARSISPEKPNAISPPSSRTISPAATNASLVSSQPATMTTPSSSKTAEPGKIITASPKLDADVPDFKGFGSIKRSSASASSRSSMRSSGSENAAQTGGGLSGMGIARSGTTMAEPSKPSASGLARSGTLTWNRRPQSQMGGSRPLSQIGGSRPQSQHGSSAPQSMAAPATESQPTHSRSESVEKPVPSRDQITATLGARDPSWFKQTADRGVHSAAYRKSQVEDQIGDAPASPMSVGRRGLPGLSRELPAEPESHISPPSSASLRSDSMSRDGSLRGSIVSAGSRISTVSASSSGKPDLKALIAEDEGQRKVSPSYNILSNAASTASTESASIARSVTMSTSQARLTGVDRPVSPTKGMGGFVQSAMMKRSDSQNKRWSAQPGALASRSNSIVSNRSGLGGLQGSHSMPKLEPAIVAAEPTKESSARPTSSNNDLAKLVTEQDTDGFVKPALPNHGHGHSRSKSMASNYSTHDDIPASPGSPSKRFSPLKSSWLESSLTKPESPKLTPAKNSQPSWMTDLASRKAQRGSIDLGTPLGAGGEASRSSSPTKETPFGQSILKRAESRESPRTPVSGTPTNTFRSFKLADRVEASPAVTSRSPQPEPEPEKKLEAPIAFAPMQKALLTQDDVDPELEVEFKQSVPLPEDNPEMPPPPTTDAKPRSPLLSNEPSTPEPRLVKQRSKTFTKESPAVPLSDHARSDATPRTPSDLRSQLKSRPLPQPKSDQQPEFLAKFGALRKTQPEKFVAPDVLKSNILRGKNGLAQTGGPVKTVRRDELKEDLLAKKDEFKKAKEEGRDLPGAVHARNISETKPPAAPSKPEALAKRELLGRSDSSKSTAPASTVDRARESTPEALVRAKSLKSRNLAIKDKSTEVVSPKPAPLRQEPSKQTSLPTPASTETKFEPLSKQTSAPMVAEPRQIKETSKLASRFNPALANMLARGPPSQSPSRNESPVNAGAFSPPNNASSALTSTDAPLQDVRKDRAKGPKRRKAGAKLDSSASEESSAIKVEEPGNVAEASLNTTSAPRKAVLTPASPELASPPKLSRPEAGPTAGSLAALMATSRNKSSSSSAELEAKEDDVVPATSLKVRSRDVPGSVGSLMKATLHKYEKEAADSDLAVVEKPLVPSKTLALPTAKSSHASGLASANSSPSTAVPEFRGFGVAARASKPTHSTVVPEDNKENGNGSPSVKTATSLWGRRASPTKDETSAQTHLSNRKDDAAAMRSAGLLAARPQPALGINVNKSGGNQPSVSATAPPRPLKSSRVVSGQLAEASPNKGDPPASEFSSPTTEVGRLLAKTFSGTVPRHREALSIDTFAVLAEKEQREDAVKTLRRSVLIVFADGSSKALAPQQEYTLYDESVFVCTHSFVNSKGIKACQVYVWSGDSAFETTLEAAHATAKRISRENGSASVQVIRQGYETAAFLHTFSGILITRQGAPESAPKQFMLRGRKHLGHILFDEVDFAVESLCAGFVYLISYPVTLQETKLYLWKGSACSTEELSAARLAAMDLSETGDIIEVDGGVEFTSFLKIFGTNTTKASIPKSTELWRLKALAPTKFETRLFRVQQAPQRTGLMTALWNRRPSWNTRSPARSTPSPGGMEVKVETNEVSPILQSQLEAEGIYILDAYGAIFVLLGPLFASNAEHTRNAVLGQTLLFASDYAIMAASTEDRPQVPKCFVLFSGIPRDVKMMFRHWDDGWGLWGTAGLMAGQANSLASEPIITALDEVLNEVCRD